MVWTLIEPGVAITAASLITIRPLLRALRFKGFESDQPTNTTQSDYYRSHPSHPSHPSHNHIQLRDDISTESWSHTISSGPSSGSQPGNPTLGRTENDGKKKGRIVQEVVGEDTDSEVLVLQGVRSETSRVEPFVVTRTVGFEVSSIRNGK